MNDEDGSTEEPGSEPGGGAGRMWGLLQDLLDAHGRERTAALLRVSERTLRRAESSRHVTPQLVKELERHANAKLGDGPASQSPQVALELASLTSRFDGLEKGTRESLDGLRRDMAELAVTNEALRERVAALEGGKTGGAEGDNPGPSASARTTPAERAALDRRYPQLVTEEAEAGEEAVYRDAMPMIAEWRSQRRAFLDADYDWVKLTAELRMTELEVELIDAHVLTLPPADLPWDGIRRHSELRRRHRTLERLRRERRRARVKRWLLRLATLGWRGR